MANNNMGEFLAALRKSKGYTQQDVAERLGVSNKTISSWETGASCPDVSMIPVLAELYEVTCDEIIRGRRIAAGEGGSEVARAKGGSEAAFNKSVDRLLRKYRTNIFTACWISGGLTALGVLLTLLIGFAALESLIGFFTGIIPLVASVVTAVIILRRIEFALGDEWFSPQSEKVSRAADRAMLWIAAANVAAFAFILPHAFAPVHTGLTFGLQWIVIEFAAAAVGLAVALAVGMPIYFRRRKAALDGAVLTDASEEVRAAHAKATADNALARRRYGRILLIIILPVLLIEGLATWLGVSASSPEISWSAGSVIFVEADELSAFGGAFAESEYSLVFEEQPENNSETGKYEVKYLFKDFPERWRDYYLTEDTSDGTIVTIYKYRYEATIDDVAQIYEFYAYNPEWQGGITEIFAEAGTYQDEDGTTFVSVIVRLHIAPTLIEQRDVEELVFRADVLGWSGFAVGMVGVIYLAVAISLVVGKERNYKKRLAETAR